MKRVSAVVAAMFAAILAALLSAPVAQAASWPIVQNGDRGDNVTTVQYLLSARGFGTTADGAFGPGTQDKVKSFQSANGLNPVDGVVGTDTWSKLIVTVRQGDNGDAVKALQVQLNAHGAGLAVDGAFGAGTDSKVRNFQQSAGLNPVDGIVGPATWAALVSGGGSTGGGGGDTLSQSQAASMLSSAGITWSSSGGCSDRNNSSCTSFDGLRRASADGAVALKHAVGSCPLNITGGTETGHASGTYSHGNGYKLDFGMMSCLTNYITGNFAHSGTRADGADLWTAPSGNIYANEGSHWDVTFMN
ncbi:peptidoglycan hydrolase-like protein with peptidoglycan-binding domain [Kitasatospora sp. MAA19]|uniref:peptidoglycan-binding domain-containing protein n=1 Tax=Kitasatospora sp. NPDC087861 TaxID=3364070 RepID=UPI00247E664B|nr:peptidoglycan hydrolase-like protein with peptidoglycan-binding domain [Kitasatospora sp. MAA19]